MAKRILVVDDDHPIRRMVCRILTLGSDQLEIEQAASGAEALELLAAGEFDLLVLDFMMPEMTGLEVLEAVRKSPRSQSLPVIMLTARSEDSSALQTLESGADYFVKKPFEPRELLTIVESVLGLPMQI
ncbi:MAG: response regulator [Candidatus Eremiobacteraeota bacterium]|nr:response regulator [Candidatus Eremiobacteraeota bacterium]